MCALHESGKVFIPSRTRGLGVGRIPAEQLACRDVRHSFSFVIPLAPG
jgi:hypothetical protein